jgi:hypothetical protein
VTFWRAWAETRHFNFEAYGTTQAEAIDTLMVGWLAHCAETGAEVDYVPRDDVSYAEIEVGKAYRDGWPLTLLDNNFTPA